MKVLIRDDDISYFTHPEELAEIYKNIWDLCPISLSVVPFHTGTQTKGIPSEFWNSPETFPLEKNEALVKFLREKIKEKKICIMLHGYNHKDYSAGPEFVAGEDLYNKVREGKKYLEELLETSITTFVPPHNSFSQAGFEAVVKNNLNIIGIPHFRKFKRLQHPRYWLPFLKKMYYKFLIKSSYPFVMDFKDHKEIAYYTVSPSASRQELFQASTIINQKNGIFCIATHYWEILKNKPTRELFYALWNHLSQLPNTTFLSANDLFQK
jgi:peptidoglycan/xylan/chitin deacetylase (PgdA/CDA1 family)